MLHLPSTNLKLSYTCLSIIVTLCVLCINVLYSIHRILTKGWCSFSSILTSEIILSRKYPAHIGTLDFSLILLLLIFLFYITEVINTEYHVNTSNLRIQIRVVI